MHEVHHWLTTTPQLAVHPTALSTGSLSCTTPPTFVPEMIYYTTNGTLSSTQLTHSLTSSAIRLSRGREWSRPLAGQVSDVPNSRHTSAARWQELLYVSLTHTIIKTCCGLSVRMSQISLAGAQQCVVYAHFSPSPQWRICCVWQCSVTASYAVTVTSW